MRHWNITPLSQRYESIVPLAWRVNTARIYWVGIHFARFMLLFSAGLTLVLFVHSPLSGLKPWSTRYLVGLLIAVPAVLWPLWLGFDNLMLLSRTSARLLQGFKLGILVLMSLALLASTIAMFASLPSVSDAIAFAKRLTHSSKQYQRLFFDGYVVYRPE